MKSSLISQFISNGPDALKTQPMRVDVINEFGVVEYSFNAPAGFQLDLYAQYVYKNGQLMVTANHTDITVSVSDGKDIYRIYRGVYSQNQGH